jgi:hypothetical protein
MCVVNCDDKLLYYASIIGQARTTQKKLVRSAYYKRDSRQLYIHALGRS